MTQSFSQRAALLSRVALPCLLGFAACQTSILLAQQKSANGWEKLAGCRLVTNSIVDGDSFSVKHKDREYIFRLYFVDAPESDASLKDRIKDQATYFGISTNDIPRAGKASAQFTREILSGAEITIYTRWRNGLGRSSHARFCAVVLVNGKDLAEELVAHGYARISGWRANWPDGERSTTFINKLKSLEISAHSQKRGIWDDAKFPRDNGAAAASPISTNAPATNALVDLNSASYEELQKLPGIGRKLAERIMAHRPYQKLDDLDKVPGIGTATLTKLKPLIRVNGIQP